MTYDDRGLRPLTMPATAAGSTAALTVESCRMAGWSLATGDIAGKNAKGSATSPIANQVIVQIASVPAGEYTVEWECELSGTLAAADADNFALYVAGVRQATAVVPAAAGLYPQENVQIVVPAGGGLVSIQSPGLATVGAVYEATLTLIGGPPGECVILDGGQTIGVASMVAGTSSNVNLPFGGAYVGTGISVQVTAGTVSGVIYIVDKQDPT